MTNISRFSILIALDAKKKTNRYFITFHITKTKTKMHVILSEFEKRFKKWRKRKKAKKKNKNKKQQEHTKKIKIEISCLSYCR